jgi:PAS domain S-box-containing protein
MARKTRKEYEGQSALNNIMFNSIGDGAVVTDEYGRITAINQSARKLIGVTDKEAIGAWFPKLIRAYDDLGRPVPLIERPITKAFVSKQVVTARSHYKAKDGTMVPISTTASPIIVNGQPIGSIEIIRDITQEYEIDEMKSNFISLASHQLRTPLSSVKTYSHMLLDGFMGPLTKPQIKALKTIISASNRMNETISTLLNITRIESGSIVVAKKPISISQIIEEVISEHQLAAADKSIVCKAKCPDRSVKVISDSVILKEVLGNLISNAIKYTPPSGTIRVSVSLKNTRTVTIKISDTGMGIPKNSHNDVFSKFFRAENVVKQETSGIGLGLYMVKGLVKELGGDVWFESKEGQGSDFYVSLPLDNKNASKNKLVRK